MALVRINPVQVKEKQHIHILSVPSVTPPSTHPQNYLSVPPTGDFYLSKAPAMISSDQQRGYVSHNIMYQMALMWGEGWDFFHAIQSL